MMLQNNDKTNGGNYSYIIYNQSKFWIFLLLVLSFNISVIFSDGLNENDENNLVEQGLEDPEVVPPSPYESSTPTTPLQDSLTTSACQGLFADNSDPTENLMSSVVSLCVPGIIKNLNRLEVEECEKILCEYEAAKNGLSPINCAKQSAYNTCMITGEGYDVVEGLLIGSLRDNIRNILENPLGLAVNIAKKRAEQAVICTGSCSTPPSKIAAIGLAGLEIVNAYNSLTELMEQFQGTQNEDTNACEELKDVEEELNQILASYNG
ncbi:MAG: hypothetical protein ACLFPL_05365 [Candidatus Nanoarchaeia archaeon]